MEQLTRSIGPGEGQGAQADQLGQALGVGEVGSSKLKPQLFRQPNRVSTCQRSA